MFKYPRIHNYEFGFGLSAEDATRGSTGVMYAWQDNALVDYETIKTNPDNADFAVVSTGGVCRGSTVGKIFVDYMMYLIPTQTEISMLKVNSMDIHTSMLNRLTAFDRKTGDTIEDILDLTHETTDEQTYFGYNGTKLFESQGTYDLPSDTMGLTTDTQPEGITFDMEKYYDALHYYSNKEMLRQVTGPMRAITLTEPLVNSKHAIYRGHKRMSKSMCKFANEYMACGEIFHVPQVGSTDQYHYASQTTAVEHVAVKGRVRFNEYNPDFNFSRA